jgi:hypothetical protein
MPKVAFNATTVPKDAKNAKKCLKMQKKMQKPNNKMHISDNVCPLLYDLRDMNLGRILLEPVPVSHCNT